MVAGGGPGSVVEASNGGRGSATGGSVVCLAYKPVVKDGYFYRVYGAGGPDERWVRVRRAT